VAAGEVLKLQLFGGRNNHGAFFKPGGGCPVDERDMVAASGAGQRLVLHGEEAAGTFRMVVPGGGLPAGAAVLVDLVGEDGQGVLAPDGRLLNKFFVLHRPCPGGDPPSAWAGENLELMLAACTMHVLGGPTDHIHAYAPSQAVPGEPVWILVRPEDRFHNLSHQPPGELRVTAEGRELKAQAEPVRDSTCVRLRVEMPARDVCRFTVQERSSGLQATANPTLARRAGEGEAVLWGMIHGHTEMSDGTGTLECYFRQLRDEAGLDFGAPGDHDHLWETSERMWAVTCRKVRQWHQPGRFVTFLGYEWAKWRQNGDGDRNVYYLHDDRPLYRSDDGHYPTPPDLFRALRDEDAIIIPHHTAHRGNFCDWKDHDPVRERLVEIYQVRGSYECSEQEGNTRPERAGQPPFEPGYVRRALALGWRVGFTGGGDDHGGYAGTGRNGDGLLAVEATERTREAIWRALWRRRTVATTGARIVLSYRLSGHPMGSELDASTQQELRSRRELRVVFHGTAPAREIAVIRNNEVVYAARPEALDCEFTWTDRAPLHDVLMPPAMHCDHPFCFYYVRATQTDGEIAWASPVWVDAP